MMFPLVMIGQTFPGARSQRIAAQLTLDDA
jgi:hypothetical protein